MNSKSFFQALRQVIREEVQSVVREELRNVITETSRPTVPTKKPIVSNVSNEAVPPTKKMKTYSNNPMLNEILNGVGGFKAERRVFMDETVDLNAMHNDFSEWPSIDTSKLAARRAPAGFHDVNGSVIPVDQLSQTSEGAAVVNALTKDYSALMKAIDKKKGL